MIGIDTTFLVQLEVREAPEHLRAHDLLYSEVLNKGESVALVPGVLAEFIHVITDPRRFERPLNMQEAVARATFWWQAREVVQLHSNAESTALFLEWITRHRLGRKRLLDTLLAAQLHVAGVGRLLTSNRRDFSVFDAFNIISP